MIRICERIDKELRESGKKDIVNHVTLEAFPGEQLSVED